MEVEVAAVVDGVLRSEDILVYCAWMLNGLTAVYRLEHGVNNWFFLDVFYFVMYRHYVPVRLSVLSSAFSFFYRVHLVPL